MAIYRQSRNCESSIIQYIEEELDFAGWAGISVEKSFKRIYGIPIDTFQKQGAICVRLSDTVHESVQIGDNSTRRFPLVLIDIFATSDGQRLDLKDCLVSFLKSGLPYYEYEISGDSIVNKTQNGRLRVISIEDKEVNFGIDKNLLEVHDRFRHLLTLNISFGKVEE